MASTIRTVSGASTPDPEPSARPAPRAASGSGVLLTELLLLMMATIWGVNFSVVKYATGAFEPLAFNAVRVSVAAAALLFVARAARSAWPARGIALRLLALGLLGNGVYQVCFVEGIARSRAGDAALIMAASPALIAVIGRIRGIERVDRRGAAGIALSILGIALVVLGSVRGRPGGATALGGVLILVSALCWSVYTVLLQPLTRGVEPFPLAALTMAGGVPFLAVAGAGSLWRTEWAAVSAPAWAAVAYSGIVALVVAYLIWYRGVRVIGPTRTAMFANLQPVIALVVAWATLNERPHGWQLVGASAIFGGLLLSRRREAAA